jgi:hypothetical protein
VALRDIVVELVGRVADGELGGDLRDPEARRLLASAELRLTRGFISITTMRPSRGWIANCTLLPPVSTPISRMHAIAASRMSWYSRSLNVCAGATVIESPVCTPIGSKFSIEQTMMTLSFLSRMTSSSNSFQPAIDSSIRISLFSEIESPRAQMSSNSQVKDAAAAAAHREPGRITHGSPIWSTAARFRHRAGQLRTRADEADLPHRA